MVSQFGIRQLLSNIRQGRLQSVRVGVWLVTACLMTGTSTPLFAASPSLETVSPAVSQRGTAFQVKLVGAGLSTIREVMFYKPGLTCESVVEAQDNEAVLKLRASDDCELGTHPFRIRTDLGITEMRTIRVSPLPIVNSAEPNDTIANANTVSLPATVIGVLEEGDVDGYSVLLQRGERLTAEVEAVRLGHTLLDTVLEVYAPDGRKLAEVDDSPLLRQEPVVSFLAEETGRYVVMIRETSRRGDENSQYALHLGHFPRPVSAYPPGAPAGRSTKVLFTETDGSQWEDLVNVPANAKGNWSLFAKNQGGTAATPNPFRASPYDQVLEAEPNNSPATMAATTNAVLPHAFNGILQVANDIDYFSFTIPEPGSYRFEVFAERLGSPIDALLSVEDESGATLVSADDDQTHDPRVVFNAASSGRYFLRIADKRESGGRGFLYRVEAEKVIPEVTAFLPRPDRVTQDRQVIVVPRGNRTVALFGVQRRNASGPVTLEIGSLPKSVSFEARPLSDDRYLVPVVLSAKDDAPLTGSLSDVVVTAANNGNPVKGGFKQIVDLVNGPADALFFGADVEQAAIAVVEPTPFRITLTPPTSPLTRNGTLDLEIKVERFAGYDAAIDVNLPLLPSWVDGPAKVRIPADKDTAVYPIRAHDRVRDGQFDLVAVAVPGVGNEGLRLDPGANEIRQRGAARGADGPSAAVSSELVTLQISSAPVSGQFQLAAGEQGTVIPVVCDLTAVGELPATMVATLAGLPNRVSAKEVAIDRTASKVTFELTLEETAPVGAFPSLVCQLKSTEAAKPISFSVGANGTLKIFAKGTLVRGEKGEALSPLEVLRKAKSGAGKKDSGK